MKRINLIVSMLFLFALVACDEKATLKVEQGGSSSGGSSTPQSSDKLWESACYNNGGSRYFRDYIELTKFNYSFVVGEFSSLSECEDLIDGYVYDRRVYPLGGRHVSGGWTAIEFKYEGGIFLYKLEGNKIIQIYNNSWLYWDSGSSEYIGGVPDENDLLEYQEVESMPELILHAS